MHLINQMDKDFVTAKKQSNLRRSKHHQKIIYSDKYEFDLQTRLL